MDSHSILDAAIRRVADFPKKGILFYDITSVLSDAPAFKLCIQSMHELFDDIPFDAVAAIEARGFFFAAPYAVERGLPLIPIRKKGKLPGRTLELSFDLEYGSDTIEVHAEDVKKDWRILIVDDLIATGGSVEAAVELLKSAGARELEVFAVIGLPFLDYEKRLSDVIVHTLINFDSE